MIKIVKTVVNEKATLIGFIMEGKAVELGGIGTQVTQMPMSTQQVIAAKLSNKQIEVENNMIIERANFSMHDLPMLMYTSDQKYVPVDNTINLTMRYILNNEHVGFKVQFGKEWGNRTVDMKYAAIVTLSIWFKPGNFVVRTSPSGKRYLAGKPNGVKIEELPAVTLGEKSKAKRVKSAAKQQEEGTDGNIANDFDILDIYNFVDLSAGYIIKLPNEKYEKTTKSYTRTSDEFNPLGIGEVADPRPIFNESKLNVNAPFKKVGVVNVPIAGQTVPVTTFTFNTKSVFSNGENHVKRLGIAIPRERENEFIKGIGRAMVVSKIKNDTVTRPIGMVTGNPDMVFYALDTSKVDLISKNKMESSYIGFEDLKKTLMQLYSYKLVSKVLSPRTGLLAELKKAMPREQYAKVMGNQPKGMFAAMSKEALDTLAEYGIDVYTGAYTKTVVDDSSDGAAEGTKSVDKNAAVSIEYSLNGYDVSKVTGAMIKKALGEFIETGDIPNLKWVFPRKIAELLAPCFNEQTAVEDRLKTAQELYKDVERKINDINKRLWLHNSTMFIQGNKRTIYDRFVESWAFDTNSRVKVGTMYKCVDAQGEGLKVKCVGVDINAAGSDPEATKKKPAVEKPAKPKKAADKTKKAATSKKKAESKDGE